MIANPFAKDSLVGIGKLVSLDGQRRDGSPFRLTPARRDHAWVAWKGDAEKGDLIIVEPHGRAKPGNETTRQMHRTFHDSEPIDWKDVQWHPPTRAIEHLGYARSLSYLIPDSMESNKKGDREPTEWVHYFGDFGGGVDERDDAKLWPGIAVGLDGTVYILRTRSSRYALKDWLIG